MFKKNKKYVYKCLKTFPVEINEKYTNNFLYNCVSVNSNYLQISIYKMFFYMYFFFSGFNSYEKV